ncbi:MAG: hypothetical protein JWL83_2453 [Actinomycetia bacterium]|nr:hypothetical protein [Actinomycetes bacterium]
MTRLWERLRRRASQLGIAAIIGSVMLVLSAAPASAHHPVVSGFTVCTADGQHYVQWTIGNSEVTITNAMTIVSATTAVGGSSYPAMGYGSPVPGSGHTSALTIVPGNVNGTLVLTVNATWAGGFTSTRTASVDLVDSCSTTTTTTTPATTTPTTTPETTVPETTTPTTTPETTVPETTTPTTTPATTVPETTSTTDVGTATTSTTIGTTTTTNPGEGGLGSTTTTSTPAPTQTGGNPPVSQLGTPTPTPTGSLPFTGSGGLLWPLVAMALFCAGVFLTTVGERRSRAR